MPARHGSGIGRRTRRDRPDQHHAESPQPGARRRARLGRLADAYRINLHSRIASRVLMRMAVTGYQNENDIYDLTLAQPWEDWFTPDHTIRVDVTAVKSPLRSLEFTTLKIK